MKYCMEITCGFGSQQQNGVVNLIASIDSFLTSEFRKKGKQRSSANLNSTEHTECNFIQVDLIKTIDDPKRSLPDAAKIRTKYFWH